MIGFEEALYGFSLSSGPAACRASLGFVAQRLLLVLASPVEMEGGSRRKRGARAWTAA